LFSNKGNKNNKKEDYQTPDYQQGKQSTHSAGQMPVPDPYPAKQIHQRSAHD
jgi:hypothetical protein